MNSKMTSVFFPGWTKFFVAVFLITNSLVAVQSKTIVPFKKNIDQVLKEWNCNKPQSRLVYLEDEYSDYNPAAIYLPHAAVVQRCDKSIGCCKTGHRCSPAEEEEVTFIAEEFLRGKKMKKEVVLTNHLRCECQSISQERK
ncbi:Uncharacterized protein APZ42_017287 [Daphnia magna]|uniref:Uncharacterized protein n=2 Tax=Daphnia magna TaxID=35525 RepID=A0ABR0AND3_9CRUS|nr:hypothetical protein OUZ56_015616 [Daphnia magna]KZS16698.1 Uncharacterized protein APZ42_017287 [Daphnia magna]